MTIATRHDHPAALGLSERVLSGLRVLNIVYGLGVGVLLIASLVAPELLFRALSIDTSSGGIATSSMRGIMVVGLAGAFVADRILTGLLQIVESVRAGDPFVVDNAERLQAVAWWLLGAELLHLVVGAVASLASTPAQPGTV